MSLDKTQRPSDDEDGGSAAEVVPYLYLLYSKESGILDAAPRRLSGRTVRLGRAVPDDEINLPSDGQASREHAVLTLRAGSPPRLRDLSSSNGTFVNGQRINEATLADGDVLRVGTTLMVLRHLPVELPDTAIPSLIGSSLAMCKLRHEVSLVAPSLATVLLLGESGTGKEVTARALHERSQLKGPLVAVNCSAIPENLAESQLFGNTSGAFTGAQAQPGYFRAAQGGTLFLDEIAELPIGLQPKLLRALEDHLVTPVGSVTPIACNVRLIAATNRDCTAAVADGKMRGDLYARLAEIILRLPRLADRKEDILQLLRPALGNHSPPLSPRLAEALVLYAWPYNVRELLKIATELRVRGSGAAMLSLDLVQERLQPTNCAVAAAASKKTPTPAAERSDQSAVTVPMPSREKLAELLREHQGKVSALARVLGRSRTQVYRWLEQMELDPDSFRSEKGPT